MEQHNNQLNQMRTRCNAFKTVCSYIFWKYVYVFTSDTFFIMYVSQL